MYSVNNYCNNNYNQLSLPYYVERPLMCLKGQTSNKLFPKIRAYQRGIHVAGVAAIIWSIITSYIPVAMILQRFWDNIR